MENELKIGEVSDIVTQMMADDKAKTDLYKKIHDAVSCVFTPDKAIAQLPFIQGRSFALTDMADAKNAGTRVFTSLLPNVKFSPMMDNQGEYDRTDKLEQAWAWEMERMNRPVNGQKGVHDRIVESAVTYHRVALQTEFLPYKFKSKTDARTKAMLSRKCFQWTVHDNPGEVHSTYSDYGLEHVAKVSQFSVQKLIENFGTDNPGVQKLLEKIGSMKKAERMRTMYTLVDYTNWTHRVQYAVAGNGVGSGSDIVFMNEPHELEFIPWVIVDYGDTLWESVLVSGHWDNLQHMKLIKFSKSIALAGKPDFALISTDGKARGVWMDWTNPLNPINLPAGTQLQELNPNKLDPQFEAEYQEDRNDVSRSTVARILQDPTPFLNAPFSTFNASVTSALGQLAPAKRTAEAAEAEAIYQCHQWIKHAKMDFSAYRGKNNDAKVEGAQPYQKGEHIVITYQEPPTKEEFDKMSEEEQFLVSQKVYFDLQNLYVNVELQSANISDEQARMNTLLLAVREGGMSQKEMWERMGWDGYEMNKAQRATEQLFDAEVQKMVQAKMMELQMQMQQAQMQQEQQAQQQAMSQQNQMNQMNAGSQMASMQGVDMRGGGMPAAMSAPNETRNTVTGQTDAGQAMV